MNVETCSPTDSILAAARTMHDKKFSQLPVVDDGGVVALLTSETIARWLAARLERDELLQSEPVESVLQHRENDSTFEFASRNATIFDALELFDKALHAGKDIDAILITQAGRKHESLLGILTPFDIPRLLKEAQLKSE